MAELYTGVKPDTNVPLNGFDFSGRDAMTWQLGALYPIWNKSVIPKEKLRIDVNHIIRTFPMTSPNFNRNRAHFDFYFVPYSQIWKWYDRIFTGKVDKQRATEPAVTTALKNVPQFNLIQLRGFLAEEMCDQRMRDVHGYYLAPNGFRLLDLLGYGSVPGYEQITDDNLTAWKTSFGSSGQNLYLNVFKIAAYQKIWATYYRDSIHDNSDYSLLYNFDDCVGTGATNDIFAYRSSAKMLEMFTQRYRQYKKDIVTGSYPSQQFGVVSSLSFTDNLGDVTWYDTETESTASGSVYLDGGQMVVGNEYHGLFAESGSSFNVYEFYKAEAVQLWRERALRAGNKYKDNYKAHFGVEPNYLEDEYPRFLGSFSTLIQIDDVVDTSSSGLGDLAGKGIATDQSKTIDFQTDDFGVVMCMFSIVPEMDYNATGIDKDNFACKQEDFVIPEFDRLGMSAITYKEFVTSSYYSSATGNNLNAWNRILGYGPRWYEHKTRVNKVHGRFQYNVQNGSNGGYNGDMSKFVQPMQMNMSQVTLDSNTLMSLSTYYINPNVADTMFSVNSDGSEATDRFFGAVQVNCQELAPMSKLGVHAI